MSHFLMFIAEILNIKKPNVASVTLTIVNISMLGCFVMRRFLNYKVAIAPLPTPS